jgi:hypothetical protein
VYQLGRGNDPMIEVGNVIPAEALYMTPPFLARSLPSRALAYLRASATPVERDPNPRAAAGCNSIGKAAEF